MTNNPNDLVTLVDYAGTSNITYVGTALPGTPQTAPLWQIQQFSYTSSNLTGITYASVSNLFNQIWASRSSLAYS